MTKVNMAAYGLIERFAALAQEYRNNNDNYIFEHLLHARQFST